MKVYLSGPMTGYPAFVKAAETLRKLGHEVYNPAEWEQNNNGGVFDLLMAFEHYCTFIIREADSVVVLPGWEASPGATAETSLAKAIGKPVHIFEDFVLGVE